MISGPLLVAAGMALLTLSVPDASYFRDYLPGLVLFGVGMAPVIALLTKSVLSVESRFSGAASGINNAVSRTAGLLAVALPCAIIISSFAAHLQDTVSASGLTQQEQRQVLSQSDRPGAVVIPPEFDETARAFTEQAVKDFIYGFRWAMSVSAFLALAGVLVSFFAIHGATRRHTSDNGPGG